MRLKRDKSKGDSFFASVLQLMSARAFMMLLQLISLPILARLLTIEDFAIVALGMVVPLFANTFSDAGFGRSLIRTPKYDEAEWSTVFWFLLALGGVLALLVILAAPIYARTMDQPELLAVVMVLACVPMMQSLMSVHQASIERAYRFDTISSVVAVSGGISIGVTLLLAYLGFGYWALVIQQVLLAGLKMIGLFWFSEFQPKMTFQPPKLWSHIRFGTNTLLFSGVMTIQNQMPVVAFNQVFGTLATSLWAMTERVAQLPKRGFIGPLSQVMMVSMSRQWRDGKGGAGVSQSYLAATRLLAAALFPGMLIVAFNGRPLFIWVLSEQWGDIALIFALAAPAFLINTLGGLGARELMVADRTDLRLRMAIERFLIGSVVFLAALPIGLEEAVIARSLFSVAYLPRYWGYIKQCVPLDMSSAIFALLLPSVIGVAVGLVGMFFILPMTETIVTAALTVLALCLVGTALALLIRLRSVKDDLAWLRASAAKQTEDGLADE